MEASLRRSWWQLLCLVALASPYRISVNYTVDGVPCQGFVAYDHSLCSRTHKCPAVVILHEKAGMGHYEMNRACLLAGMGYVALAADIYCIGTAKVCTV